jgi:hypothetical protein
MWVLGARTDSSSAHGLHSRRRIPQGAAAAAAAAAASQTPREAGRSALDIHPSAIYLRGLCGLRRSPLGSALAEDPRFFPFELHLLRKRYKSCGGLATAKASQRRDAELFQLPAQRDGLRCARNAMHAPCTRRRTGRAPCSRREHAIARTKSTPCANAARMPCAHQVHRSRTRGRSWGRPRASRSTSRYL